MSELSYYFLHDGMEWAEFFVNEPDPRVRAESKGRMVYSATWVAYSSFGVFGHHWADMGVPFEDFIFDVGEDYLLGKIARGVFDMRTLRESLQAHLAKNLAEYVITPEEFDEACDACRRLTDDYSGEAVLGALQEHGDVAAGVTDWGEIDYQIRNPQAVQFVRRLWPKFVQECRQSKIPVRNCRNENQ